MRISGLKLTRFRRFADLEVAGIPESAKLVVLTGPNGSGKSSVFDALLLRHQLDAQLGWSGDLKYYDRKNEANSNIMERIKIATHSGSTLARGSVYMRSAYRNDHEFMTTSLNRQDDVLAVARLRRLIEPDATVAVNYQRLASQAMEDVFVNESPDTSMGAYREKMLSEVRIPLQRLFPDLVFVGIGNPLDQGSFQFDKGSSKNFDYKNLSGGEKAAFDLILDFVVKRRSYPDAIYCIDEPETHMNTKLQGALLGELVGLIPGDSQLWIASHSIGMMRKARELHITDPESVAFIDFGNQDFDQRVFLEPSKPTRAFWEGVMNVALDDLAALVVPSQVIICEGNPTCDTPSKNVEHDAKIYGTIFRDEMPDVTFISAGSSIQVQRDTIGLATVIPKLASGMKVTRLIDRDDHALADVLDFNASGTRVLSRRNLECYLYDDEVLSALCDWARKPEVAVELLQAKQTSLAKAIAAGFPSDDLKKAAGDIYNASKRLLHLTQVGNDAPSFAREILAKLIKPGMHVYDTLRHDVFSR